MSRIFISFLLIMCSTLLLTRCTTTTPEPEPDGSPERPFKIVQNPLYPLAVGNYWKYRTIDDNLLRIDTSFYESKIIGDTTFVYENKTYQCIQYRGTNWVYWSDAHKAIAFLGIEGIKIQQQTMQYPIQKADSFSYDSFDRVRGGQIEKVETVWVKCIATDELITTPAGTFHCYVFREKPQLLGGAVNGDLVFYSYYAFGVGIVALRTRSEYRSNDILVRSVDLVQYTIK